jgi:hypothetical protein
MFSAFRAEERRPGCFRKRREPGYYELHGKGTVLGPPLA